MACPLCDNQSYTSSWLGTTHYNNKDFEYVECKECRSLYCQPMPDTATLAKMYGMDYFSFDAVENVSSNECSDPTNRFDKPLAWLKKTEPALLLDYGCGDGELLESAGKLGWKIAGVDFDPKVTERVSNRLNAPIVTDPQDLGENFQADVLHLGDVVEHLTKLNHQMPDILKLLKPNGFLLAQGPLEANSNLFTFYLKKSRKLRGKPRSEMPPYHVMLATAKGQKRCFERFGLRELEFKIDEVSHPAPEKISFSDLANVQKAGMYGIRKISQGVTALNKNNWGNRYFYVGQLADR